MAAIIAVVEKRSWSHRKRFRGVRSNQTTIFWRGPWRRYEHQARVDLRRRSL